jgi:hypothetical protein
MQISIIRQLHHLRIRRTRRRLDLIVRLGERTIGLGGERINHAFLEPAQRAPRIGAVLGPIDGRRECKPTLVRILAKILLQHTLKRSLLGGFGEHAGVVGVHCWPGVDGEWDWRAVHDLLELFVLLFVHVLEAGFVSWGCCIRGPLLALLWFGDTPLGWRWRR